MQKKLDAEKVIHFFKEISKIPRGSYNEKQISDYLFNFGKDRGLYVRRDDSLNVIIKKPASIPCESSSPIIIQSHMDMVCEKNKASTHDFEHEGIKLIIDGDTISADQTTLGADNGIGVAYCLALLDDADIKAPPIEAVFTTGEEVGLLGAAALDTSDLDGKILINLDSEQEGVFTCGCAGGLKAELYLPVEYERVGEGCLSFSLFLRGLKGGHSGNEIDKGRANANILMGRILNGIRDIVSVSSISGGIKDNAIPREAEVLVNIKSEDVDAVKKRIDKLTEILNSEYKNIENICVLLDKCEQQNKCFSADTLKKALSAIMLIPNGVMSMSAQLPGLPESSNNLGVIRTDDAEIIFVSAVRSSVVSKKHFILDRIKAVAEITGGHVSVHGDYPAWEFDPDSEIRKLFLDVYEEMYGSKPYINVIHAGLECGVFAEKIKGVDMISIGPDMTDIHTPDESLSISSVERVWEFLKAVLESRF